MAYKELIGHFSRVRAYMQHFYVYGFRTRDEFEWGSARSYDDERRRVEGWLHEYMGFRSSSARRSVFISFDSRQVRRNPLYRALKSKSFTDRDVTLHFLLLDLLAEDRERTAGEIIGLISQRLHSAIKDMSFDEKTIRGKLGEYEQMGLLLSRQEGSRKVYRLASSTDLTDLAPALAFFSETAPCGVIGSYLEDRLENTCEHFRMKHHYLAHTLDSDVLCELLSAIRDRCDLTIWHMGRDGKPANQETLLPVCILRSVHDGRIYLVGWALRNRVFRICRIDRIAKVQLGKPVDNYDEVRQLYDAERQHRWGASHRGKSLQHITFTIRCQPWEPHIRRRLYRECRCGQVEELEGSRLLQFSADLYDPIELLPWVRTFIGRITAFACDNALVMARFRRDLAEMHRQYAEEEAE